MSVDPADSFKNDSGMPLRRRRIVIAIGIAFISSILVPVVQGIIARHQMAEHVKRLRATGEPVLIEDFADKTEIPDRNNAALLYREAYEHLINNLKQNPEAYRIIDTNDQAASNHIRAKIIDDNRHVVDLIRSFKTRTQAKWNHTYAPPLCISLVTHDKEKRLLWKFAKAAAEVRLNQGNLTEPIEIVHSLLTMANALDTGHDTSLIRHLNASTYRETAALLMEKVLPNINRFDGAPCDELLQELGSLQASFLDEKHAVLGWQTAGFLERASAIDAVELLMSGNVQALRQSGIDVSPSYWLTRVFRFRRRYREFCEIVQVCDHYRLTGIHGIGSQPPIICPLLDEGDNALAFLLPSYPRAVNLHFASLAHCRMAAVAIALKRYEYRNGRRPAGLNDILPEFLSEIPNDPMSETAVKIRYAPDETPPTLSLADDPGRSQPAKRTWRGFAPDRQYYYLNGDRPDQPRPSTKTIRQLLEH